MNKNLIFGTIAITVGLILCGAVLAPVIEDANTVTMKDINEEYLNRMSPLGNNTITLSYDGGAKINGAAPEFHNSSGTVNNDFTIVSDSFVIARIGSNPFFYYIVDSDGTYHSIYSTATGTTTTTAVIGQGKIVVSNESTTLFEGTYTWCYVPDDNGEYVYSNSNCANFINPLSDIVVIYGSRTNNGTAIGPITDLRTAYHVSDDVIVTSTYQSDVDYDTVTIGESDLASITTSGINFIIPRTYSYEEELGGNLPALLSATLVMVIVAILGIAVRMTTSRE